MRFIAIVLAVLLHGMAGCSDTEDDDPEPTGTATSTSGTATPARAMAQFRQLTPTAPEGAVVGWVNFTEVADQLTISVIIRGANGLNATAHGIHVHTNGDCGGDGTTAGSKAGGHFNPNNATHGAHAGDLGNIMTDASGNGARTILDAELKAPLTLGTRTYGIMGRSVVVHADPDDETPTANAGPRVLCGVIGIA